MSCWSAVLEHGGWLAALDRGCVLLRVLGVRLLSLGLLLVGRRLEGGEILVLGGAAAGNGLVVPAVLALEQVARSGQPPHHTQDTQYSRRSLRMTPAWIS